MKLELIRTRPATEAALIATNHLPRAEELCRGGLMGYGDGLPPRNLQSIACNLDMTSERAL